MVNVTLEIFILYHIRKYTSKNFSCVYSPGPLHGHSGAIEKDHLTVITERNTVSVASISIITTKWISEIKISKIVSKRNIRKSLKVRCELLKAKCTIVDTCYTSIIYVHAFHTHPQQHTPVILSLSTIIKFDDAHKKVYIAS